MSITRLGTALALTWFGIGISAAQVLTNEQVHRLVAATCPVKWSQAEEAAMVKIAWKESRFNCQETCRGSSSAGLWGFLDSTRRSHRLTRASSLEDQTKAAWAYVLKRYGSAVAAYRHHQRRNWY